MLTVIRICIPQILAQKILVAGISIYAQAFVIAAVHIRFGNLCISAIKPAISSKITESVCIVYEYVYVLVCSYARR